MKTVPTKPHVFEGGDWIIGCYTHPWIHLLMSLVIKCTLLSGTWREVSLGARPGRFSPSLAPPFSFLFLPAVPGAAFPPPWPCIKQFLSGSCGPWTEPLQPQTLCSEEVQGRGAGSTICTMPSTRGSAHSACNPPSPPRLCLLQDLSLGQPSSLHAHDLRPGHAPCEDRYPQPSLRAGSGPWLQALFPKSLRPSQPSLCP